MRGVPDPHLGQRSGVVEVMVGESSLDGVCGFQRVVVRDGAVDVVQDVGGSNPEMTRKVRDIRTSDLKST